MISRALIALLGFLGEQYWKTLQPMLVSWVPTNSWLLVNSEKFPINGQWIWGIAMAIAIGLYIVLSLLTCREDFNLDRMLHRGKYAVDAKGRPLPAPEKEPWTWRRFIGIDSEMTKGDRRLAYFAFSWTYLWWMVAVVILVWNLVPQWRWSTHRFTQWFFFNTYSLGIGLGLITTIWFTWGGLRDLRRMFVTLRTQRQDIQDDGRVINHHNADEAEVERTKETQSSDGQKQMTR
jgi:SSS family solute:Na+ symporter